MADAYGSMAGFVLKAAIDVQFEYYYPSWYETRLDAWIRCYNIHEDTITLDEVEFEVYLAINTWMAEVWACRLIGGCEPGGPRCELFDFINAP